MDNASISKLNSQFIENNENCEMNFLDVAWVSICAMLMMLMTPAVGFIYAGLVHKGSIASMLGICFSIFAMINVVWCILGYSLVYGDSQGGIIGNLKYVGLSNLMNFDNKCMNQFGKELCLSTKNYWETCSIPEILFVFYSSKFASITPVLLIGSMSERMYLKYSLLYILIWTIVVYCPIAHWIWNEDGFLNVLGTVDFAGGLVVHLTSGFSGLITSLALGKRKNFGERSEVQNFPFVILGTMLVWFGWYGFVGGSSYKIGKVSVITLLCTNITASASICCWIVMDLIVYGKITALGIALGTISGLVGITPSAGYISYYYSFVIGSISGLICWLAIFLRKKYKLYDDLDIFACHGICGLWGTLAAGLFAQKSINPLLERDGLIFAQAPESKSLIGFQLVGITSVIAYCCTMTFIIIYIMKKLFTLQKKSDFDFYYDNINYFDEFWDSTSKKCKVEAIR
jgi:Amt family ammonium transporter